MTIIVQQFTKLWANYGATTVEFLIIIVVKIKEGVKISIPQAILDHLLLAFLRTGSAFYHFIGVKYKHGPL